MLEKDPKARIGIYDLIGHEWITDDDQNPVNLDLLESSSSSGRSNSSSGPDIDEEFTLDRL